MKKIFVADYNNSMKQNKKGFTLIELVVAIAILAIISAIAIPVVSYQLNNSRKNVAIANARTIEYAIKEAQAAEAMGDDSVYTNIKTTPVKICDVATKKGIADAFEPVTYNGTTYTPAWSNSKVYFVNGTTTIDGLTLSSKTDIPANSTTEVNTL